MTIDELAQASGVTARNIRAYQDRGLLPPPERIGRSGYYDDAHLTRLRVISRLLGRGFTLAAIRDLLQSWEEGRSLNDVLGFEEAIATPYEDESPAEISGEELAARFGDVPADLVRRAIDLGFLAPAGGGRFRVPSVRMLDVGLRLVEAGYPLEALLAESEKLREEAAAIAARWIDLWETYVWGPFNDAGRPPEEWVRIAKVIENVRSLPSEIGAVMLAQAMTRETDRWLREAVGTGRPSADDGGREGADDRGRPER